MADLIDTLTKAAKEAQTMEARHALLWALGQVKFYLGSTPVDQRSE